MVKVGYPKSTNNRMGLSDLEKQLGNAVMNFIKGESFSNNIVSVGSLVKTYSWDWLVAEKPVCYTNLASPKQETVDQNGYGMSYFTFVLLYPLPEYRTWLWTTFLILDSALGNMKNHALDLDLTILMERPLRSSKARFTQQQQLLTI